MRFFFTGSLGIMLRHQPTKLLLTGMFRYVQRKAAMLNRLISVEELAKKKGVTMAQIAIAWILTKDGG